MTQPRRLVMISIPEKLYACLPAIAAIELSDGSVPKDVDQKPLLDEATRHAEERSRDGTMRFDRDTAIAMIALDLAKEARTAIFRYVAQAVTGVPGQQTPQDEFREYLDILEREAKLAEGPCPSDHNQAIWATGDRARSCLSIFEEMAKLTVTNPEQFEVGPKFVRYCQKAGWDIGVYDEREFLLAATPAQLAELRKRAQEAISEKVRGVIQSAKDTLESLDRVPATRN